jgi:hypothetical protein
VAATPRCHACFPHLSCPKCLLVTVTLVPRYRAAHRPPCTQRRRSAGIALCAPVVAARTIACLSQARSSSLASRLRSVMASSQLGADHFHGCTHSQAAPTYCGVNASGASFAALLPHLPTLAAIGPRQPFVAVVLCVLCARFLVSRGWKYSQISSLPGSRPHRTSYPQGSFQSRTGYT